MEYYSAMKSNKLLIYVYSPKIRVLKLNVQGDSRGRWDLWGWLGYEEISSLVSKGLRMLLAPPSCMVLKQGAAKRRAPRRDL